MAPVSGLLLLVDYHLAIAERPSRATAGLALVLQILGTAAYLGVEIQTQQVYLCLSLFQ
jgi:hypothetical protein